MLSKDQVLFGAKEIVDQALKALNLNYEIKPLASPRGFKRFCLLDTKYDCVIIEHIDTLFVKVIDYLKTMLNIKNLSDEGHF